jgi:hypothetical protein
MNRQKEIKIQQKEREWNKRWKRSASTSNSVQQEEDEKNPPRFG